MDITGRDFQYMHDFVYAVRRSYVGQNVPLSLPQEFNLEPNSLFSELYDYMVLSKIDACVDFGKITSWGIRKMNDKDRRLIIVDHGMNDEIYNKHYKEVPIVQ